MGSNSIANVGSRFVGGDLLFQEKNDGRGLFRIDSDTPIAIARGRMSMTATSHVHTGLASIASFAIAREAKSAVNTKAGAWINGYLGTSGRLKFTRWNKRYAAAGTAGSLSWIAIGTPAIV